MELILLSQDEHTVSVTCDGQASHTFDPQTLPFSDNEEAMSSHETIITYGRQLYAALFAPDSLARQALAAQPERIVIVATTPELEVIPWEYVYGSYGSADSQAADYTEGFLLLECPFVRGLPAENRIDPPTLQNGLHIVGIAAEPLSDTVAQLDMSADWDVLAESIVDVEQAMTLERVRPPTIERVRQVVAGKKELVLYFSGHGGQTEEGAILCFEQENGDLDVVPARDLVHRLRGSVFLVVLSACVSAKSGPTAFSNLAASLTRQKIPYALGMRFSVYEDDARAFTNIFFSELGRGSSVEEALLQARLELARRERLWMIGAPVLYTSLREPASGFVAHEGTLTLKDPSPPMEISALAGSEGLFQGRQEELKTLGSLLTADQRPRLITLHAGGGQGKSALARAAVERFAWAWPGGVWALSLDTLPRQTAFVSKLARFLGIPAKKGTTTQALEQQILQRLSQKRTLLVFDNVETLVEQIQAGNTTALHLVEWLNQLLAAHATLFMISHIFLGWPDESTYDLSGLSDDAGAALFAHGAPQRREDIDLDLARLLSSRLDGHPLSLRLLAGAFNVSKISLDAFTQTAEAHLQAVQENLGELEHGQQRKLYSWIETSLRFLQPSLRELLSTLWVFSRRFLPETVERLIAQDGKADSKPDASVHDQLHQLWLAGLLTYTTLDEGDETFSLYRLEPALRPYVEHHLKQVLPRELLLANYGAAYAALLERIYTGLESQEKVSDLRIYMHDDLERASAYLTGKDLATYLCRWGWIVYRAGDILHALHVLEQARGMMEEIDDPDLAWRITDHLAQVYHHLGLHQKALDLYNAALTDRQARADRSGEAVVLNNLAEIYRDIQQPDQALPLFERALPIRREVGDRAGEALTLNNLADLLRMQGKFAEAATHYEQALTISCETGNKENEALALNGQAEIAVEQQRFEDAQKAYDTALELLLQIKDAVTSIRVMNNVAALALRQQDMQQAFDAYARALSLSREVKDSAGEATTLMYQAQLLMAVSQPQDALSRYQSALTLFQELEDEQGQLSGLSELARCQEALEEYPLARTSWQSARDLAHRLSSFEDEIASLISLATLLYQHLDAPDEASAALEEAIGLMQKGTYNAGSGQTLENLQSMLSTIQKGESLPASVPASPTPDGQAETPASPQEPKNAEQTTASTD